MTTRTHPRPGARWERVALVLSLAVNLAVAGVVAGFLLRGPAPERDRVYLPIEGMRHIHRVLPPEERAALRSEMRARFGDLPDHRAHLRELRGQMLAALAAEPFDPKALDAVMAEQSTYWRNASDQARAAFVAHVEAMTPQARANFARALAEANERPRRDKRD